MLFLLISSLSFFLVLFKSFPLKTLVIAFLRLLAGFRLVAPVAMATKKKICVEPAVENVAENSILDLPELTMELILEKLSPVGLCNMAGVCSSLRERCRSDYLWERHMGEKWGKVIGGMARRQWELYLASKKETSDGRGGVRSWAGALACLWPLSMIKSIRFDGKMRSPSHPDESIMSWYLALEGGKFWFPAQVYNREHGHVGFVMSCYDAELSYDCHTDTFQARYPPHGRRTIVIEEGVQWDRLRAPPVDTSAHDLHVSDCLNDLHPGDHIEIQWRRNKEFPYGWWYGMVGHLDECDGNEHFCRCSSSDTVILEFNQYTPGSRWRRSSISRKDHQEEGNETDGFYGGIRKLHNKDEISTWTGLWPTEVLE